MTTKSELEILKKMHHLSFTTFELYNKEILVVGFGRIGQSLIKRCLGFEMKIKVFDPFVSNETINQFWEKK